jgi:hypothetical protein
LEPGVVPSGFVYGIPPSELRRCFRSVQMCGTALCPTGSWRQCLRLQSGLFRPT